LAGSFVWSLDLNTKQHQVRFLAKDEGASYSTITDDPSIYRGTELNSAQVIERLERAQSVFNENSLLTELAVTCFALPAYFRFKVQLVREEQRETRSTRSGATLRRKDRLALAKQRIRYRKVTSLEIIEVNRQPIIRSYTPPRFQLEVNGFWRRLAAADKPGRGHNGEPVLGRTWVKGHMRWRDKQAPIRTVYVKSSIQVAKAQVAALQASASTVTAINTFIPSIIEPPDQKPGDDGYLYVMRCPAMDDNIYKVGWTAKEPSARAEELSRATGVPLFFVVVEHWRLKRVREIELLAHEPLANYRISSRREFFKAPMKPFDLQSMASFVQERAGERRKTVLPDRPRLAAIRRAASRVSR
jgi:T5orf172 domain